MLSLFGSIALIVIGRYYCFLLFISLDFWGASLAEKWYACDISGNWYIDYDEYDDDDLLFIDCFGIND